MLSFRSPLTLAQATEVHKRNKRSTTKVKAQTIRTKKKHFLSGLDRNYLLLKKNLKNVMAKRGLYANINARKAAGTSRSKKNSTISPKAYANMKAGFPKSKAKKKK